MYRLTWTVVSASIDTDTGHADNTILAYLTICLRKYNNIILRIIIIIINIIICSSSNLILCFKTTLLSLNNSYTLHQECPFSITVGLPEHW